MQAACRPRSLDRLSFNQAMFHDDCHLRGRSTSTNFHSLPPPPRQVQAFECHIVMITAKASERFVSVVAVAAAIVVMVRVEVDSRDAARLQGLRVPHRKKCCHRKISYNKMHVEDNVRGPKSNPNPKPEMHWSTYCMRASNAPKYKTCFAVLNPGPNPSMLLVKGLNPLVLTSWKPCHL